MKHNKDNADQLRKFIEDTGTTHTFALNGPENVVIKNRAGDYRRANLIGEEMFYPVSSYLGKKGEIIVCFKPRAPQPWVTMEMSVDEATDKLDMFGLYMDTFQNLNLVQAKQEAEVTTINRMEDPAYASW